MSETHDAGPQVAEFREGSAPMPHDTDNIGPEVAPFRPGQQAAVNPLMLPIAMLSSIVTNILGVAPGTATYTPTNSTVMTWCDNEGMTIAALQFDPVIVEVNPDLNKKQLWMLQGLTTDMEVELRPFVDSAKDDDSDTPTALVWGVEDGNVQVTPELKGSEAEIKAAVKNLSEVLNAAKRKSQAEGME